MAKTSRAIAIVALALALGGCGYHFATSGSALPSDAQTIYVARFGNHTRQTGINDQFMRYIDDEIARHARLRIVDDPTSADLELTGDMLAINTLPSAFNSVLEPTIYNETITVSATLKDLRTDKVLWSARALSNSEQTPVVSQAVVATTPTFLKQNLRGSDIAQLPDLQVADTQHSAGTDQAMTRVAQNLYASMAEGF